ncbi:MAG: prepilin-type N-terminal cleavage/methylation domain-containing protein [Pseudomonadota bacterium]
MNAPAYLSRRERGIALLEALIAIVILAIGLLGTVGLQARSYSSLSDASMRAEATIAAEKLLGIMSNDVANISAYAVAEDGAVNSTLTPWVSETLTLIPTAKISVTLVPDVRRTRVDIRIRWTRKAGGQESIHLLTSYIAT